MTSITQTLTRPAHDGRMVLEITVEGGRTHIFEVASEPYYTAIATLLKAPDARRIADAEETAPSSSFDPREEVGGS